MAVEHGPAAQGGARTLKSELEARWRGGMLVADQMWCGVGGWVDDTRLVLDGTTT